MTRDKIKSGLQSFNEKHVRRTPTDSEKWAADNELSEVYGQGYSADPGSLNPHPKGSNEHRAWQGGTEDREQKELWDAW